jgi:hypothetical protein
MQDYNLEDAEVLDETSILLLDNGTITEEELLEGDMSPECWGKSIE